MRSRVPIALALALAAPAAIAGEEPPAPPPPQDARSDYAEQASAREVRVPNRSQYFRTPGGHSIGDFIATFFAGESVTLDDNVFLGDEDTQSDIIFASTLGGRMTTEGARVSADLSAALTYETYLRDSNDPNLGGWIDLTGRYGLERGFYARVTERLLVRDSPVTTSLSAPGSPVLSISQSIVRSYQNDFNLTLGMQGEKSGLDFSYVNFMTNYGRPLDTQNLVEHRATLVGRKELSPKTDVGVELERRAVRYEEDVNSDSDVHGGFVRGGWAATPKTSIAGRVGVLVQRLSTAGMINDDPAFTGGAGVVTAHYEAGPQLFVDGTFSRDLLPGVGGSYQLVDVVATAARWEFRLDWLARAGLTWQKNRNSDGTDGVFYTVDLGISWNASGSVQASLFYQFQRFQGNDAGVDYLRNMVGAQVSIAF